MAWSKAEKPTSTPSKTAKPTESWDGVEKPFSADFFLMQTSDYFLLQNAFKFMLNRTLPAWAGLAKPSSSFSKSEKPTPSWAKEAKP